MVLIFKKILNPFKNLKKKPMLVKYFNAILRDLLINTGL